MMRRFLVLSDEAARHPFLASLPPHVRSPDPECSPPRGVFRLSLPLAAEDVRRFLTAYCTCLVGVAAFIF